MRYTNHKPDPHFERYNHHCRQHPQETSQAPSKQGIWPDSISVNVLRNSPHLDIPLQVLFNQSIQTGQVPQEWRDANISPINKKGSRSMSSNYRTVSLTRQVVKLMERILYQHLLDLATRNKIISCHQHGFQNQCSCVTQLLEFVNDWTRNYDESAQTYNLFGFHQSIRHCTTQASNLQTQNIRNPRQGSTMDWGFPKQQKTMSSTVERVVKMGTR